MNDSHTVQLISLLHQIAEDLQRIVQRFDTISAQLNKPSGKHPTETEGEQNRAGFAS
jgi:hypothetical protein